MPPLRHAMRLVHGEQAHPALRQRRQKRGGRKPLRRAQDDPRAAATDVRQGTSSDPGIHTRRDHRRRMPAQHKPPVLIRHQRDQRGDHDRQRIGSDPGQLVTQALAAAGRHHHKTVAPRERRRHSLTLPRPKSNKAKMREQRIGITRPVVAALPRNVDVDAVQPAERELSGGLVIEKRRLQGRAPCASASARAASPAPTRSARGSDRHKARSASTSPASLGSNPSDPMR